MTEDGRPSTPSSDDLPRRVRGASSRAPGTATHARAPAEAPATAAQLDPAGEAVRQAGRPLPHRVPGASDFKAPRPLALVQPVDALTETDAAPTVPLPATSGLPAPYAAARRPGTPTSPLHVAPSVSGLPSSALPGTPPSAAASAPSRSPVPLRAGAPRKLPAAPGRRWWLAGAAICAAVAVLVVALYPRGHAGANPGSARIAAQTAVLDQAAAWVAGHVGHNILVACDALTCAALAQHGFPAADLNVLQSTAPDLYGTQVVVATASVRSQFGAQLASVFAPEVLASFGAGANRIDIRVIAPDGPATFRTALAADVLARKAAGAQLLTRSDVTASAGARSALVAGDVDARLLTVLAFVASQQPVAIVGFGGAAQGASPGVPLRVADLASTDPAAGQDGAAYEHSLLTLLHSEVDLYAPTSIATVRLASGQRAVQVTFAAPSPLGLLG
jgi:hypothetical protein